MKSMILLLLLAICITSCTTYPDVHPHHVPCKVLSFTPTGTTDTTRIAYNSKGDPVVITPTGSTPWYFLYDNKGRVSDYYHPYTNGSFDVWHRFKYDSRNRITTDSIYEYSNTGPDMPLPDDNGRLRIWKVVTFTYDAKNRIIKTFEIFGESYNGTDNSDDTAVARFTYNTAGNLVDIWRQYKQYEPETATPNYDNKVNINSLHPIWQLLARDYSVNNSFPASSYNEWGLPLDLDFTSHAFGQFGDFVLPATTFIYSCK